MALVRTTSVIVAGATAISMVVLSYLFSSKEPNLAFLKKKKKSPRNGLIDAIGNTPLIRINGLSDATSYEILGKCEFLNPGGSVKDRVVVKIIEENHGIIEISVKSMTITVNGYLDSKKLRVCKELRKFQRSS